MRIGFGCGSILVGVGLLGGAAWSAEAVTAIVGGTAVYPEKPSTPAVPDTTIVLSGDRIQAIGPSKSTAVPKGASVVNAKGKWVIPGLIDSHVHFFQSGNPFTRPDAVDATKVVPYAKEVERNKARLPATFKVWIASGVTSVADVGGPFWNFEARRAARESPVAPRVVVAGPLISMIDRPQLDLGDPPIIKITSPDEARALVKRELDQKPDFIKVWFIHRPGDNLQSQEAIVKATGDAAHAAGLRLLVHATELDVAKAALRAGADVLVHSVQDKLVDSEFLHLAKANKALYIPTLFVTDGYALVIYNSWKPTAAEQRLADPEILAQMNDLEHVGLDLLPARMSSVIRQGLSFRPGVKTYPMENLRRVWDAGIPVAMGTDAGNIGTLHGPSVFREMQLMVDSGLSMSEVLKSATVNGAKTMGLEKDLGTLERGKLADLVILNADPLGKVDNLSDIYRVVKGGKVFDPGELLKSIR
jgi:imidazolonepropionase-like amidohydrolase